MEEIIIRGKTFTKDEVEEAGSNKIRKQRNLFRWLGVGLFAFGIIALLTLVSPPEGTEPTTMIAGAVMLMIPGVVLFILSFRKRDPFEVGKKALEKHFPAPIGFDGNVVDVLDGDKT